MPVFGAPLADAGMRLGKTLVGSEMDRGRHPARWQLRAVDAVVPGKRFCYLGPDLHGSLRIQIQSDMPAWFWQAGGADKRPDLAACGGNKPRQFSRRYATAHHRREGGRGIR